jgi:hypothetical protein
MAKRLLAAIVISIYSCIGLGYAAIFTYPPITSTYIAVVSPTANNATALTGDSRMVTTFDFTTTAVQSSAGAFINFANILNKQYLNLGVDLARSGATVAQIRQTFTQAIASKPAFVAILGGVNSLAAGLTDAATFVDLQAMYDYAIASNVRPIIFTDWGAENFTSQQTTYWQALNASIINYASTHPTSILVDLRSTVLNNINSPGFKTGYSTDGVHLNQTGAYAAGVTTNTILSAIYPAATNTVVPASNIVVNSDFATGTGGSVGTGNTGTIPLNFTGARDGTNSTVFSLNTRGDALNEIVVATTCTNAAGTIGGVRILQTVPTTGFNIGDKVIAFSNADVDAGYTNLNDVRVEFAVTYADSTFIIGYNYEGSAVYGTLPDNTGALQLALQMRPLTITKALGTFSYRMSARCKGPGGFTARFRQPYAIKG